MGKQNLALKNNLSQTEYVLNKNVQNSFKIPWCFTFSIKEYPMGTGGTGGKGTLRESQRYS